VAISLHQVNGQEAEVPPRVIHDSFETTLVRRGKRIKILIRKPQEEPPALPPNPIVEALRIKRLLEEHVILEAGCQDGGSFAGSNIAAPEGLYVFVLLQPTVLGDEVLLDHERSIHRAKQISTIGG